MAEERDFDSRATRDRRALGVGGRGLGPPAGRLGAAERAGRRLDGRRPCRWRPGMRVLELAAGTGEVGFRAAPLIEPGGTLICSDQSEAMVEVARARAQRLGARRTSSSACSTANGSTCPWRASTRVLCRWGYMLMADPARVAARDAPRAAQRRARSRSRSGTRAARTPGRTSPTACWSSAASSQPTAPGEPGPFALADRVAPARAARRRGLHRHRDRRRRDQPPRPRLRALLGDAARPLGRDARRARAARRGRPRARSPPRSRPRSRPTPDADGRARGAGPDARRASPSA